jgi:hypothetical protein
MEAHHCGIRKPMSREIAGMATASLCALRNNLEMAQTKEMSGEWLAAQFERTGRRPGKEKKDLARKLGKHPSVINRIIEGGRKISFDEAHIIRQFFEDDGEMPALSRSEGVPEIDVRGGSGGGGVSVEVFSHDLQMHVDGVKNLWGIPPSYLRQELRANPDAVRMIEVLGDSMEPTLKSGDRVMIDTYYRAPSPPGIYAVWDGFGVVVKRIELVPLTDPPRIKLISDNRAHGQYEVSAEEARIIGRVVAKVSLM